jgi:alkylation response protein AidB-like acyl-CoA dehydrogenase
MILEPTASELAMIEQARRFAETEVAPNAAAWEHERRYPIETLRAACAAGLAAIELPVAWGGAGHRFSCKLRVVEEISRHDYAFAFALVNHHNAMVRLTRDAPRALAERLLPRMRTGELIGCTALTEPGAGSDFAAITTQGRKVEGGWRLDGAKAWIANAAVAGVFACYAQTAPGERGKGIGCFLIEADRPGFVREAPFALHGGHAIGVGGFRLENYFVPDEATLQAPGTAFKTALTAINGARAYVAAMCCGMLEESLATALRYTARRTTFGQPVYAHQGVRWKLVDAATDLEAMRLLTYRAAALIDSGGDAVMAAAHAKKFATEKILPHIAACMQAMGANGLRAEHPIARHLANARIAAYTDGSIEIMNERIGQGLAGGLAH